jgi:hypothetical protein
MNKHSKLKLIILLLIVSTLLSSCTTIHYTKEQYNETTALYTETASAWFKENLPDATDITYEADTYKSQYLTNLCVGTFTLNNTVYNYALNTDTTKQGFNANTVNEIMSNIIKDYYTSKNISLKDVEVNSWYYVSCNHIDQADNTSRIDGKVKIHKKRIIENQYSEHQYLDWNMTEEELYNYCNTILTTSYSSYEDASCTIIYNTFDDIKDDMNNSTIMNKFPDLHYVDFYIDPEQSVEGRYSLWYNGDKLEYYYHTREDGTQTVSSRHYQSSTTTTENTNN